MGWISEIIKGIAHLLKVFFGMDKPEEKEIKDAPTPDALKPTDDELDAGLGMHNNRSENKN